MYISNKFSRGDFVYLTTDPEQKKRVVICITVFDRDDLSYTVQCGTERSDHYDFEISLEPDKNLLMGIEPTLKNG